MWQPSSAGGWARVPWNEHREYRVSEDKLCWWEVYNFFRDKHLSTPQAGSRGWAPTENFAKKQVTFNTSSWAHYSTFYSPGPFHIYWRFTISSQAIMLSAFIFSSSLFIAQLLSFIRFTLTQAHGKRVHKTTRTHYQAPLHYTFLLPSPMHNLPLITRCVYDKDHMSAVRIKNTSESDLSLFS